MTRAAISFDVAPDVRLVADAFGDPDAPAVLLLHGGGQTRHAWHATAANLADSGRRAITVDLRGHGQSTHPRPPAYALEDFAADTRALIATIAEEPIVIGASLGGIAGLLALTELSAAPASGLVLVDVAHRFQPRGGGRIVSFMEEHSDGFATLTEAADAIDAYLSHRARPRDTHGLRHNLQRNEQGRWIWHWDPEILTQTRPLIQDQAQFSERLTTAATRLRQPCLLVRGAESDVLSADIAREFIQLAPTATLTEVPHAGHMVAGDNNDAFTAVIRAWLDTSAPRISPTRTRPTKTVVDRTRVEAFLRSRGAERLVHPGGSLYEHLCRASVLLSDWGAEETIQMAGLCHACYGTDGFDRAMVDRADRQVLVELIGPAAESLVYLYCSCDRAVAYPLLADNGPVVFRDRFTGRLRTPSEQEIRDFMEVTAANELDALAHNQALLAEHGAGLFTLFTGARDHLSDSAWRASVDLLGAQD
ncbi:MAG TPA: alpha/beta hydrolase, partial [Solirubrobacteraceae bacterium]|nr:alpha/beta hydrolase [Solirubrobacteraceae bacterium]